MTVKKGEQSKRILVRTANRCLTATSLNEAVSTTHCGIGIVSELIKLWVGAQYGLSPDALAALYPAKTPQTFFPLTAMAEEKGTTSVLRALDPFFNVNGGGTNECKKNKLLTVHYLRD